MTSDSNLRSVKSKISVKLDGKQKEPFLERFVQKVQYADDRGMDSGQSLLEANSTGTKSLGRALAAKIDETKASIFNRVESDDRS